MVIYLNGIVCLWAKRSNGTFYEIASHATPALDDEYNVVKSISHSSVLLNIVLQAMIENKGRTRHDEGYLLQLYADLRELREQQPMERKVIDTIMHYIVLILGENDLEALQQLHARFLHVVKTINETYAARATSLQLDGLHSITSQGLQQWNIDLKTTRVLIVCTHGPREGLIEKQYFQHLYAKHGLDGSYHIIDIPMLPQHIATVTKEDLIHYLKNHQINMRIGESMLGDPGAMNKDILSAYAPDVLESLCPYAKARV